jgi:glycerol-3-phosphate acyltransferase PlsY
MEIVRMILALLAAFMIGSIPTAYVMGRIKGIDIRLQGSGNVGATNAFRVLGKGWGVACLGFDILKGWLPARALFQAEFFAPHWPLDGWQWAVGLAAIAGHMFSPFLKFKGGKGVATSLGVILAIAPLPTLAVFVIGVATVVATGYVSAGSVLGAALLPVLVIALGTTTVPPLQAWTSFAITFFLGAAIIYKHRANIRRLRAGTEKKILPGFLKRTKGTQGTQGR